MWWIFNHESSCWFKLDRWREVFFLFSLLGYICWNNSCYCDDVISIFCVKYFIFYKQTFGAARDAVQRAAHYFFPEPGFRFAPTRLILQQWPPRSTVAINSSRSHPAQREPNLGAFSSRPDTLRLKHHRPAVSLSSSQPCVVLSSSSAHVWAQTSANTFPLGCFESLIQTRAEPFVSDWSISHWSSADESTTGKQSFRFVTRSVFHALFELSTSTTR